MRRVLVKSLRNGLQSNFRGLARPARRTAFLRSPAPHTAARFSTKRPQPEHVIHQTLHSSMQFRRLSAAFASGVVGYGAWYAYQGGNSTESAAAAAMARGYSSTAPSAAEEAVQTRSVLMIGPDEIFTGTYVGEAPLSKSTDGEGRRVLEMLTPEQTTKKLRKTEESYLVNRGQGVVRFDTVQLPSNDPIEDDLSHNIVPMSAKNGAVPGSENDWMFWGVFDGHSGWTTSAKLRQTLISFVGKELNETYKAAAADPTRDAVDAAIKNGFTRLDDEIVNQSVQKVLKANNKTMAAEMLSPALSGSCALLSFYDTRSKLLRVACTGDSRAVLGRRSDSGKWAATPLSVDQTGNNPDEEARLRKLHPGEDHVVRNGRVLGGLEPTRAFGDASYKWTRQISDQLRGRFFGRSQSPLLRTPPYVTAEPEVTTTQIQPEHGDFVVMATDGLWEMLTNEEVVGLVGKWIETQATASSSTSQFNSVWSKIFGSQKGLPIEQAKDGSAGVNGGSGNAGEDGQKTPIRVQQWGLSPDAKDRFVVQDKNVATHLVRNALGGKNEEQVSALLTLPSPYSRRYRDDLTVQVIFFGHGEKSGEVVVNDEATAASRAQPKL